MVASQVGYFLAQSVRINDVTIKQDLMLNTAKTLLGPLKPPCREKPPLNSRDEEINFFNIDRIICVSCIFESWAIYRRYLGFYDLISFKIVE